MKIRPTQAFVDRQRAEALLEKWAPVLNYSSDSVKEIKDENKRLNTAILLENQEQWCVQESSQNSAFGGNAGGQCGRQCGVRTIWRPLLSC